jgi:hypothetical protein
LEIHSSLETCEEEKEGTNFEEEKRAHFMGFEPKKPLRV